MKNKTLFVFAFFAICLFFSCDSTDRKKTYPEPNRGSWLMKMQLEEAILPFSFELKKQDESYQIIISNAEEKIQIDEVKLFKDSIEFQMPVFESAFYLKVHSEDSLSGTWINYYRSEDYVIDVWASQSDKLRFTEASESNQASRQLFPKYEVTFSPNETDSAKAIGLFETNNGRVKGTFATETGDYRYLEGKLIGDSLFLSTFDGSHAFYFSAAVRDSSLEGIFLSGIHHRERWLAKKNDAFELRDPDSLTALSSNAKVSFSLPNTKGELVSLDDSTFENKIKIIQIMGSWCPNCLDESRYFKDLYAKYAPKGLEIIALAFERSRNEANALHNLERLTEKEKLSYPILLGGYSREDGPSTVFPMLDKIRSYPTSLFLDRDNRIRKIHTGFYGPGTGKYYDEYRKETEAFVEELLDED